MVAAALHRAYLMPTSRSNNNNHLNSQRSGNLNRSRLSQGSRLSVLVMAVRGLVLVLVSVLSLALFIELAVAFTLLVLFVVLLLLSLLFGFLISPLFSLLLHHKGTTSDSNPLKSWATVEN